MDLKNPTVTPFPLLSSLPPLAKSASLFSLLFWQGVWWQSKGFWGESEWVPVENIETKCLHQESQGPGLLHPLQNKQQLLHQRLPLCLSFKSHSHESVSNMHLKSSIQKITKSWPFIPLNPSRCNENMYLTEKTLRLPSPWPLCPFFSLSLRAQNVMIHLSTA